MSDIPTDQALNDGAPLHPFLPERSTPPSSIEEVAKRVKELLAKRPTAEPGERWVDMAVEVYDLAPQLAAAVLRMLPVVEAARNAALRRHEGWALTHPRHVAMRVVCACGFGSTPPNVRNELPLCDALAALDTSSFLAAEGTTE